MKNCDFTRFFLLAIFPLLPHKIKGICVHCFFSSIFHNDYLMSQLLAAVANVFTARLWCERRGEEGEWTGDRGEGFQPRKTVVQRLRLPRKSRQGLARPQIPPQLPYFVCGNVFP